MYRDPKAHGGVPSGWLVYFAVEDINETVQRVNDGGGRLLNGPFDTPVGQMIVAADPLGAVFHAIMGSQ